MAAVVVLTALAYLPSMHGRFLWDDDAHVIKVELRSLEGLSRIWFEPGATQQYYPLLYSAFWIEHKLWGDSTVGYHVVQLSQHLIAAVLVWLILLRLNVPGALLAAALFAVHPVQVESVAWISEQKNTLSAVFYLSAMLALLRFDSTRNWVFYGLAFGLFLLGLLTKTVTATLPAALLVIFWWQRGRISMRRDVLPLVPFFTAGAIGGVTTAWLERKLVGAEGIEFDLSLADRVLIAGRAIWFYVGKLIWPANLTFIYPRWQLDATAWWQWLFPIPAFAALVVLWAVRYRWRAPLAGSLFFVGTLFPVLGFLNVFPFIYSFVADHFQYLACLGVLVLIASGIAIAIRRQSIQTQWVGIGLTIAIVVTLAVLTYKQSLMYSDPETLYRTTLERNPDCWMVANNLGNLYSEAGQNQDAIDHYQQSLRAKPDYADAHNGLAVVLARTGETDRALEHYKEALKIADNFHEAHNNLANLLMKAGNLPAAIEHYRKAIKWKESYAPAHNGLGNALRLSGEPKEAIAEFKRAIELQPDFGLAYMNLAITLYTTGETAEGIRQFQKAVEVQPDFPDGRNNLANALVDAGRIDEAFPHFEAAIRIKPDYTIAHLNLANALVKAGRHQNALEHYEQVLQLSPESHNVYANLVLTLAALNRSSEAIKTAQHALEIARASGETNLASQLESWLREYQASHQNTEP